MKNQGKINSAEMKIDLFEFDEDASDKREEVNLDQWMSDDDDEGEESPEETRAFWDSQHQLLQEALSRRSSTEVTIQRDTEKAIKRSQSAGRAACTCNSRECRCNCLLRVIADRLRDAGYNSAVCKSKWRRSPEIPSGEHNYIDVVMESKTSKKKSPTRMVIELNFRAEFEMARANSEYNRLVGSLPEAFVGKSERLRGVIRIMCAAAKKCMTDNKMHMAPWRKQKYMQSKWLGTCERAAPGLSVSPVVVSDRPSPTRRRASMLTFDLHCSTAVEVV